MVGARILTAAIAWVSYIAVEPYVRRYWPQIMITWSRLLGGKFRDPLVGRDILLGGMCGIMLVLAGQLSILLPSWLGLPPPLPQLPGTLQDMGDVLGLRYKLNILITTLMISITLAIVVVLLMLVLRVTMRRPWLASTVSWLLLTLLLVTAGGDNVCYPWLASSLLVAVAIVLLVHPAWWRHRQLVLLVADRKQPHYLEPFCLVRTVQHVRHIARCGTARLRLLRHPGEAVDSLAAIARWLTVLSR